MTIREEATGLTQILQADGLPGILVTNRPLRDIANDALCYLTQVHTPLYVRHGQLPRFRPKGDRCDFFV
jgi:hypothetical protein